jgi:hypothetical protein
MTGGSNLFLRDGRNLTALSQQPYNAEVELQALLAEHPELLPGEAIDPDEPRRFLLIRREAPVGGGQLDHLFVDQEAVPTLVESKQASNREGRRKVVAQMLDYAASAAGEWDAAKLTGWLADRCRAEGRDAVAELEALDHDPTDASDFWAQVEQNLRDGKVRLIFISDSIPESLQRIVEFLNERMTPTEVLAAEVKQYSSADGKQLLQTNLVGQTQRAREVKSSGPQRPEILPTLVENGIVADGAELWVRREKLTPNARPATADDVRLKFVLDLSGNAPQVVYQPNGEDSQVKLYASRAVPRVNQEMGHATGTTATAVHDAFSLEPDGPSLGDVARQRGLWT